jgi:hypothetical protein
MGKITVKEADKMYDQWHASGTDQEFKDYFGLSFSDLAEIAHAYAIEREKKAK